MCGDTLIFRKVDCAAHIAQLGTLLIPNMKNCQQIAACHMHHLKLDN